MNTMKNNFIKNPSTKNLILFTVLWTLGIVLLILSTTDLFTESFFKKSMESAGKTHLIYEVD